MKNIRKIFALCLALSLMLALSATALATGEGFGGLNYTDDPTVTITKLYRLEGAGKSPAETFTLRQIGEGIVRDGEADTAPALGTIRGASFAEGAAAENGTEGSITVELPVYERVGVYEYILREVSGTTAGVSYYGNDIRLVVTVINDEESGKLRIAAVHTESTGAEKSDSFENVYAAGTLRIGKTVTGILGDKTRYFKFTLTLNGEAGKTYAESYRVTGGSYAENPDTVRLGESTVFYLKHDETLSVENLPYGVSYTVEETENEGYTVTKENDTGTIRAASVTAAFRNNKGGTPDTGITTDPLPYIAMLALTAAASLLLLMRKRGVKNR